MRNDLVTPPRLRNPKIPKAINDIVMRAMAPEISARYQRAGELLDDVLAVRGGRRTPRSAATAVDHGFEQVHDIQNRLKSRETPAPRFCWHCRKPLHARSSRCPFCGETQ
jgi:hypothetical protein